MEMLAEENSSTQTAVVVEGRRRQSELGDAKNLRSLTMEMGYVLQARNQDFMWGGGGGC